MKKSVLLIFTITVLVLGSLQAQTDDKSFSFQGYAVDSEGKALGSESINVRFSLYQAGQSVEYTETHTTTTDAYGVFTEEIGSITPIDFKKLNFNRYNYKLKVEVKKTSEGVYTTISDAALLSVPYARNAANGVPVGSIMPFAGTLDKIPPGWLACNGASVLISDYPQLYDVIGNAWGHSGSHFNLPDLRGVFMRGVDHGRGQDPDRGGRSHSNNGGNTGDNVGSYQYHAFKQHNHGADCSTNGNHNHKYRTNDQGSEDGDGASNWNTTDGGEGTFHDFYVEHAGNHNHTITIHNSGANETRPVNVYVEYIVKY